MFQWDENKRLANIAKHGIDFVRAALIFKSPVLERVDNRLDYGEERMIALGHSGGDFTVVIYTRRGSSHYFSLEIRRRGASRI